MSDTIYGRGSAAHMPTLNEQMAAAHKAEVAHECEQCEHYDISQGVYTVECYSCKRYHVDMFTQRAGA